MKPVNLRKISKLAYKTLLSYHIREFIATQIQPLQLCQSVDGPEKREHTDYYTSLAFNDHIT